MIVFLNYGDKNFILSRKRISLEAQNLNYFEKNNVYICKK